MKRKGYEDTLARLWQNYQMEDRLEKRRETDKAITALVEAEKKLHSVMNEEQRLLLQVYDDALAEISGITECNAFIRGVQFATKYMLEALS